MLGAVNRRDLPFEMLEIGADIRGAFCSPTGSGYTYTRWLNTHTLAGGTEQLRPYQCYGEISTTQSAKILSIDR